MNPIRIAAGTAGNKGRKYAKMMGFLVLDLLMIVGCIYVAALQSNALYLENILAICLIIFCIADFVLAIVVLIYFRISE